MNEERKMILEILKNGDITVEEAERLMEALQEDGGSNAGGSGELRTYSGRPDPKRLVVQVTENGRTKVNVRVPFSLVRLGLKMGKTFGSMGTWYSTDESGAQAMEILQSIDVDEIIDSLKDGDVTLPYTIVDVEEEIKGERVLIILE